MPTPPVKIVDRDGGSRDTLLYNVQENMRTRTSDPSVDSIYSRDSEETFIVSLEEKGSVRIKGTATGVRLSGDANYSNDPLTALTQYVERITAYANPKQGIGWEVVNDYTGRTIPCIVEQVEIIMRRGEKYQAEFTIEVLRGDGMMPQQDISTGAVSPSTTSTLAGQDLHEVEELLVNKRLKMRQHTYALHDADENEVEARSGARQDFIIKGNVPGSESTRKTFDDNIDGPIGNNESVTYSSGFMGKDYNVVIQSHDSTREAGVTQLGGYYIEATEGKIT